MSVQITLKLRSPAEALELFGHNDEVLKTLKRRLSAKIVTRGDELRISGNQAEVREAERTFRALLNSLRQGHPVDLDDVQRGELARIEEQSRDLGGYSERISRRARPKTEGQRRYIEMIADDDITFGIGPAGTGKTYLAVAMAATFLKEKRVKRIILTRPAVEAGERLGFLPGDLQDKINPYLRPLYDALHDMMDAERFDSYVESGVIEVAPLAFMRGRTLNDAFIILDEAQNTTPEQMKMFLTRMGFHSRVVVTGDITQTDLPGNVTSGLAVTERLLRNIDGIGFHYFTEGDVVRHPLVGRIIKAYDQHEKQQQS